VMGRIRQYRSVSKINSSADLAVPFDESPFRPVSSRLGPELGPTTNRVGRGVLASYVRNCRHIWLEGVLGEAGPLAIAVRREHGGRLVCVGIDRVTALVLDRRKIPD
jgi:hypothetical protein